MLVRDDDVDGAVVREIGERDGTAVVLVSCTDGLGDVDPASGTPIQVDA